MKICIIRHGETDWNKENLFQGRSNISLNDVGISQAKELAISLKNEKIDLIISSPLDRAVQTAQFINEYHNAPLVKEPQIVERALGDLEGKNAFNYDLPNLWNNILNLSKKDTSIYHVETLNDMLKRCFYFLESLISKYSNTDKNIYIVCHGSIILALLLLLGEVDISKPLEQFQIKNCCCYTIQNPSILDFSEF